MNILAIDTADQILSIALEIPSGLFYTEIDAGTRHSELLMECVDGLFKTAGFRAENLGMVACMKGPGSYRAQNRFFCSKRHCLGPGNTACYGSNPGLSCLLPRNMAGNCSSRNRCQKKLFLFRHIPEKPAAYRLYGRFSRNYHKRTCQVQA